MAFAPRDASPDILELPTSPLNARRSSPARQSRSPTKEPRRVVRAQVIKTEPNTIDFSSPSKSMVLDTPRGKGEGQSPWRIRVTVEAEPHERSPCRSADGTKSATKANVPKRAKRKGRAVKVPVKGLDGTEDSEVAEGLAKVGRKRKGTPIRRSMRKTPPPLAVSGSKEEHGLGMDDSDGMVDEPEVADEEQVTLLPENGANTNTANGRTRVRGTPRKVTARTQRTQRLSYAREELDSAVKDAVGGTSTKKHVSVVADAGESDQEESEDDDGFVAAPPGDLTVTENEAGDFSMVSVQSLERINPRSPQDSQRTAKGSSDILQIADSSLQHSRNDQRRSNVGNKSALSVSWMPSSPPVTQAIPQPRQSKETSAAPQAGSGHEVMFWRPADAAITTSSFANKKSNVAGVGDPSHPPDLMSWRRTGRARSEDSVRAAQTQNCSQPKQATKSIDRSNADGLRDDSETSQQYEERKKSSWRGRREARLAARQEVKNPSEAQMSRPVQYPVNAVPGLGNGKRRETADLWFEEASREDVGPEAPEPTAEPSAIVALVQVDGVNDGPIEAENREPPRRSKIPRTWRRSSGVDFLYSDSPAHLHPPHLPLQQQETGKGVVEGSQPNIHPRGASPTSSTGGSRASGVLTPPSTSDEDEEQDDELVENSDADLTIPDAEATRLYHHQEEDEVREESEGGTSPDADGDDTGMFWQSNMPQVYPSRADRRRERGHQSQTQQKVARASNVSEGLRMSFNRPRPERPRPQRLQKAMNLSELLDLPSSPAPQRPRLSAAAQAAIDSINAKSANLVKPQTVAKGVQQSDFGATQQHATSSSATRARQLAPTQSVAASGHTGKTVSSPLRKSLLNSSKLAGNAADAKRSGAVFRGDSSGISQEDNSFASKASHERQLLGELGTARRRRVEDHGTKVEDSTGGTFAIGGADEQVLSTGLEKSMQEGIYLDRDEQYSGDEVSYVSEERDSQLDEQEYSMLHTEQYTSRSYDDSRSYEEHLNKESPTKVQVNFGSSMAQGSEGGRDGSSSLLLPRGRYVPLFGEAQAPRSPPSVTLDSKKSHSSRDVHAESKGFFSRLSCNFWQAVTTPSLLPSTPPSVLRAETLQATYSPSLRAKIRSRYGVVSSTQPWTFCHMRTLHRMHNSCWSGKSDSIIPRPHSSSSPAVPDAIGRYIGHPIPGGAADDVLFDAQHAQIVLSMFQVLVPPHVLQAMESGEVAWLGDGVAAKFRGLQANRWGDEDCFDEVEGSDMHCGPGGITLGKEIGVEFVVKCLGAVILAQRTAEAAGWTEEKQKMADMAQEQEVYDNDDDDDDQDYDNDSDLWEGDALERVTQA